MIIFVIYNIEISDLNREHNRREIIVNRNINSKIIKYSIRKLSLGAAAVIVGALIFGNYTPGNIANAGEITFKYVEENELNESEKVLIKREIPERYKENRTYYLVYKKINEKKRRKVITEYRR